MNKEVIKLLKQYYGYDTFRTGQEELIDAILDKRDVLGIMPTGGGKSICYQIPSLVMRGVTIVVSPLISLMKDQVDTLDQMGFQATYINSTLSQTELSTIFKDIQSGMYKIIYVAPERLESDRFINLLNDLDVSLVAIDEAHCISQWGHDFRPSYTRVARIINGLKKRPVLAGFTATATLEVKQDIIDLLELNKPLTVTTGFDRKNLYFEVVKPENKSNMLLAYLQKNRTHSGIIYCSTRKTVDALTAKLNKSGYAAVKYHAGLSESERNQNQEDFIFDRKSIMVATNAFGMGIDKSNIRFVIHYNMPKDLESYYQEAGRAGRDGLESDCLLLYGASDVVTNKFLINTKPSNQANAYAKLNDMVDYCNTDKCLRHYILSYFGDKDLKQECNHCGNCQMDVEKTDITVESQKIMSCIKRMNERFGASVVTDVLRGANNKKIRELNFNELSTYGIMKDYHKDTIKEIISYLITEKFISIKGDKYPILALNQKSSDVLTGKETVQIKRVIEKQKTTQNEKEVEVFDDVLFEELRQLRKELAEENGVPPFVIFSDVSLQDMSRYYPVTKEVFLSIKGVGVNKLDKYGEQFMKVITDYKEKHDVKKPVNMPQKEQLTTRKPITDTRLTTYELHSSGKSIDVIVEERGLSQLTIENHLLDCLKSGLTVDFEGLIQEEYELKIVEVIREVGSQLLKPIKDALPEAVTYTDIKFTIAKHQL